ncbi:Uncharacterized protein GBIM_19606 [Gryllus bimaculatus]|nr:Uncharacterized protein GBIM_19606 [Gryllus bimaculatus]
MEIFLFVADCLPDLHSLFKFLDIEKYYRIFNHRNIGIKQFLMLTENDLRVLGVKCLGPRRKMSLAICQLGNKFHIKSQMD